MVTVEGMGKVVRGVSGEPAVTRILIRVRFGFGVRGCVAGIPEELGEQVLGAGVVVDDVQQRR